MWISEQTRRAAPAAGADLGVTSISGGSAGVVTKGETRELPVYGPGGYCWQPETGQTVLVIKGGTGGEETCVAGAKQAEPPEGMKPGEVYIFAGEGGIYLKEDGKIEISGQIELRGNVGVRGTLTVNGEPYKRCECGSEVTL